MRFRCPELLDLARGAPCLVGIPGVCNADPATTVAAHSPMIEHGHGMGQKSDDCFVAFACSACHDVIDGRAKASQFSVAQRRHFWRVGFEATVRFLWGLGLVGVIRRAPPASRSSRPLRRARRKDSPTATPSKMLPRRL